MQKEYRKPAQSNINILDDYQIHDSLQSTVSMQNVHSFANLLSGKTIPSSPADSLTLKFKAFSMGSIRVKTNWKHGLIMGRPGECLRLGFIPAVTLIH